MTRDEALRILSEIQHGLVSRRQAHRLRFDDRNIGRRVTSGEWHPETHRVVRRTGAPRTREQQFMLAVLDGPVGSFLSGRAAAELWQIQGFAGCELEISHPRNRLLHPSPVARVHRPLLLLPHHVTEVRGIPVTTLPRTLFDIAHRLHEGRLDIIIERVIAKSPGVLTALHELLPELAQRGRPGIAAMRAQLAKRPKGYVPVASGLERRFDRIANDAGLGRMRRQVDLGGHEWIGRVDFVDVLRIIYEVDSILHHTTPGDRARDGARDKALLAAGFAKVVRITEEDVWYQPDRVVELVRAAQAEITAQRATGM